MVRIPHSPDNDAARKTANATEQLVKLNEEASKQTLLMTWLTIIMAILTLITAWPMIRQLLTVF